jgi:hypothetical protein
MEELTLDIISSSYFAYASLAGNSMLLRLPGGEAA